MHQKVEWFGHTTQGGRQDKFDFCNLNFTHTADDNNNNNNAYMKCVMCVYPIHPLLIYQTKLLGMHGLGFQWGPSLGSVHTYPICRTVQCWVLIDLICYIISCGL